MDKMAEIIEGIGTDFNNNWQFTDDGDLKLVSDEENLTQAIINRLTCPANSLNLYYADYGSVISKYFGWRKNDTTLKFMEIDIKACLDQDPRINDYTVQLSYTEKGIRIDLNIDLTDEDFELSLILTRDGDLTTINYDDEETEEET
jgi:hypothetical protein